MRILISALSGLALILATTLFAGAAAAKHKTTHKSHKAPSTQYMRVVPSGTAQPGR